jgi:superfamily I DNA and RNA helicase
MANEYIPWTETGETELEYFKRLYLEENEMRLDVLKNLETAEAEIERLNKMRTHCENCGGDYLATGLEVGCPCLLNKEIERLRARLGEITFLEDECTQLRQGYTAIRDDTSILIKNIKQLNDDAIHNEGVMVALKEGYLERGAKIEELEDELAARGERDE